MKTMIKVSVVLLIGFCSCDMYSPYSMSIDNRTMDTIEMIFTEGSPYYPLIPSDLTILPQQKKMFYVAEGRATKNGCGYTGIKKEEVEIYTSSGRILKKDIGNVDNWDCQGSFRGGWAQTFVITEDDLE